MNAQIFDAHLHIIDPAFPPVANNGYLPDPFTADDYLAVARPLGVAGGAVVSGSFQAFDQTYLLHALARLGPGFVGVTQLPASTSDEEIRRLDEGGVRAVRFNLKRGGSESVENLEQVARRVHELAGWHVELYVDARDLPELQATLLRLPAVSIDHLGLSKDGFPALRDLHAANPHSLMFGTDLPSTRAPRPFEVNDIALLREALGDDGAELALWKNAAEFYRLA